MADAPRLPRIDETTMVLRGAYPNSHIPLPDGTILTETAATVSIAGQHHFFRRLLIDGDVIEGEPLPEMPAAPAAPIAKAAPVASVAPAAPAVKKDDAK